MPVSRSSSSPFKINTGKASYDAPTLKSPTLLPEDPFLTEAKRILDFGLAVNPRAPELLHLKRVLAQDSDISALQEIDQMIQEGNLEAAVQALKDALFSSPTDERLLALHRRWKEAYERRMT